MKHDKKKLFNQNPIQMAKQNLGLNTTRDGLFDDEHHRFVHQLRWKIGELNQQDKAKDEKAQVFYDKQGFKSILIELGIRTAETYAFAHKLEHVEPMLEKIQDLDEFVIKPNSQSIGKNILVLERDERPLYKDPTGKQYNIENLRDHIEFILTKTPDWYRGVILEERIKTHPKMNKWNPFKDTITDLRLYLVYQTIPFGKLRIPTKESGGLGNTFQGAAAFHVDSDGIVKDNNYFRNTVKVHPDTKRSLIGEQLPFWDDICRIGIRLSLHFKLPFHSVDLTVDTDGEVCIVESERVPQLNEFSKSGSQFTLGLLKEMSGSY